MQTPKKIKLAKVNYANLIGIEQKNIVSNLQELKKFIKLSNLEIFIAEEYINGNECTISSLGNGKKTIILPILWYKNTKKIKVLTYDAKWVKTSEAYRSYKKIMGDPEKIHLDLMKKINKSFNIKDYSKADFIEKNNIYYLIDISPNPTLTKDSAFVEQFLYRFKKLELLIPTLLKYSQ